MTPEYQINPQLLREFIDESQDSLLSLDAQILALEENPGDIERINAVFRPFHSLKGNAAFFGLLKVKEMAHKLEDLLDRMRQRRLEPRPDVVAVLLSGLDCLKAMLRRVREGLVEVEDEASFQQILAQAAAALEKCVSVSEIACAHIRDKLANAIQQIPKQHRAPVAEILTLFDKALAGGGAAALQPEHGEPEALARLEELLNSNRGDMLNQESGPELVAYLKQLQTCAGDATTTELLASALDTYETLTAAIGFDPLLGELLRTHIADLRSRGRWAADRNAAPKEANRKAGQPAHESADRTIRISEKNIDAFLAYVGELIVIEEMFGYLQKNLAALECNADIAAEFKRIIENFSILSDRLQKSILAIRRMPARPLLQKAFRIARDIGMAQKKEVKVVLEGELLLVDKSHLELLDAPLTHMVRNAADHGIESPEQRQARGKPTTGVIAVSILERSDEIVLAIEDDGRGIDTAALRQKAVSLGYLDPNADLNESEILDLVFLPGLSTAKSVTDVSGRGVGMDVVKRSISEAGGRIEVQNRPLKGTTFSVFLPKNISTQIIHGFIVKSGGERYILPMERVRESFSPAQAERNTLKGRMEMVDRRGEILPVIRLSEVLGEAGNAQNGGREIMVSIETGEERAALCVDEIIGTQKVVVKPVEALQAKNSLFEGGAMMGDGRIAMIIGSSGLRRLLGAEYSRKGEVIS